MLDSKQNDTLILSAATFLACAGAVVALGTLLLVLLPGAGSGILNADVLHPSLGITAKTAWHFSRSSGTVAFLLLAASTIWGLLLSSKMIKQHVPAALSLGMHKTLSWLAILLTGLHALVLLADNYYSYTLANLLIPFTGPYRVGWVGIGIIAFYIMVLTSGSFYLRKRIGQKLWRRLHYLTFAAYLMATFHGIQAGTDSGNLGMQLIYWGSGFLVLTLTFQRMLVGKASANARAASRGRSA